MHYDLEKQHSKGKLHAIERLSLLLDEGSFQEIGSRVQHSCSLFGMDQKKLPYDGVITGFGKIHGRPVAVYSQDFSVMGGTLGEMHGKKIARILQLAIDCKCPVIGINDSGGARIQEGIHSLAGYGDIFRLNTLASGYIPQISVIVGPCAGGAVYSPGITDFVFMVDSISHMFVTGPNVVKKVLYQDIDKEALGGSSMHASVSGVCHFRTTNEESCFGKVRSLLSYLPQSWDEQSSVIRKIQQDSEIRIESSAFLKIPHNPKVSYDVREVVKAVVDDKSFLEISEDFAKNLVIGFAGIAGSTVGVVANQTKVLAGVLDCDASDKASRFIRFCDAFNIPLLTFVDVPGFLPGLEQERKGIIRHGAKLLFAYAESTVPKITIILRKAYGGAYIAMCSKHLGSDFVYSWDTGEIAVMGAEGAVEILFKSELQNAPNPKELIEKLEKEYADTFVNPTIAAESGIVDEIIEPDQTRKVIIQSLIQLQRKEQQILKKKHGNIPL
ncbi:MAG: methylmalonyl-CoA carboxyltransferase [Spirochaetae bacterium HGW-Spirochaetae-2]|nr:MAG: methylmalonyl-CoA carboxyltransferase [Spirochaetae bacterium HGW-Spirochaetae-2]